MVIVILLVVYGVLRCSVLLRWVVDLIVLLWHIGVGVASVGWEFVVICLFAARFGLSVVLLRVRCVLLLTGLAFIGGCVV